MNKITCSWKVFYIIVFQTAAELCSRQLSFAEVVGMICTAPCIMNLCLNKRNLDPFQNVGFKVQTSGGIAYKKIIIVLGFLNRSELSVSLYHQCIYHTLYFKGVYSCSVGTSEVVYSMWNCCSVSGRVSWTITLLSTSVLIPALCSVSLLMPRTVLGKVCRDDQLPILQCSCSASASFNPGISLTITSDLQVWQLIYSRVHTYNYSRHWESSYALDWSRKCFLCNSVTFILIFQHYNMA